jgi:hypothetical protein
LVDERRHLHKLVDFSGFALSTELRLSHQRSTFLRPRIMALYRFSFCDLDWNSIHAEIAAVTAEIMVTFGDPVSQYQVKVQWLISVGECIARYASICPKIENVVTDTSTCLFLENLASLFLPPRLPFSTVTHQLLNLVVGHQFWPPRAMIPIQASLGCLAFQVQLNSFGVVSELLDTVHCRDLHSIRE